MPLLLVTTLWFGGLGLVAEDPPPMSPSVSEVADSPASPPSPPGFPAGAFVLASAVMAAAALARKGPGSALGLRPPEDALVVFVPGHGQGEAAAAFGDLIDLMGLDRDDVRFFDYRLTTGQSDPVSASQRAPIDDTVRSLNAYVAAVAAEGRPVYLVGFSKGGASVASLIAAWDDGAFGPADSVAGAFLLDPPIASGTHGWLQSVGMMVGTIPDDGGYDPVACGFLWWGCHDEREHLGKASGVEVLVVRNPKAGITSFSDHPEGLRVVDAPDQGRGFWDQMWRNPLGVPGRVEEAHESVLTDGAVAACLVNEMRLVGSCGLEPSRPPTVTKPYTRRARPIKRFRPR